MNPFFFSFFEWDGALTYKQERSGYGDRNFILNCGSVFWFFVIYFALLLPYFSVVKIFKVDVTKRSWLLKIDRALRYNFLITLVIEGFIELLFSAVI